VWVAHTFFLPIWNFFFFFSLIHYQRCPLRVPFLFVSRAHLARLASPFLFVGSFLSCALAASHRCTCSYGFFLLSAECFYSPPMISPAGLEIEYDALLFFVQCLSCVIDITWNQFFFAAFRNFPPLRAWWFIHILFTDRGSLTMIVMADGESPHPHKLFVFMTQKLGSCFRITQRKEGRKWRVLMTIYGK
jgi:hypothetical protein